MFKRCEKCDTEFYVKRDEEWKTLCKRCFIIRVRESGSTKRRTTTRIEPTPPVQEEVRDAIVTDPEPDTGTGDIYFDKFMKVVGALQEESQRNILDIARSTRSSVAQMNETVTEARRYFNEQLEVIATKVEAVRRVEHIVQIGDSEPRKLEGVQHKSFDLVLKLVANRGRIMLVGPAGSGKTTICENVAKALNVPYYFHGALYHKYDLIGFKDVHHNYQPTDFYRWATGGGVFLLDEFDSSNPDAFVAFHSAANGYVDFPVGKVDVHEDCYLIAACNTFGRGADRIYVGRHQLDGATLDRFGAVDIDYDEELEMRIASPQNPEELEWVKNIQRWRGRVFDLKLRHIISPRASFEGVKMLRAGIPRKELEKIYVWKGLEKSQVEKITGG